MNKLSIAVRWVIVETFHRVIAQLFQQTALDGWRLQTGVIIIPTPVNIVHAYLSILTLSYIIHIYQNTVCGVSIWPYILNLYNLYVYLHDYPNHPAKTKSTLALAILIHRIAEICLAILYTIYFIYSVIYCSIYLYWFCIFPSGFFLDQQYALVGRTWSLPKSIKAFKYKYRQTVFFFVSFWFGIMAVK